MDSRPKHRCDLPFHHMAVRPDGKIYPCCYFKPEHIPDDLTLQNGNFNHPFMNDLRKKMLKDEYVPGCESCYRDEEISGESMRTDVMFGKYNFLKLPEDETRGVVANLTNIDLTFSNKCNNACRMCGPDLSTKWYAHAKKMGYAIPPRGIVDQSAPWLSETNFTGLTFIKVLGGEPLMEQDKLIKLLQGCNRKNLTLHITTNGTLFPNDELLGLLQQLHEVYITVSIDQFGKLNEYLRKGSNWDTTVENLLKFKDAFEDKHTAIHSVTSIYNVNMCNQLVDYAMWHRLPHRAVVLDGPEWMAPRNLPFEVKHQLITMVEKFKTKNPLATKLSKTSAISNAIQHFDLLLNELKQDGDFGLFMRNDTRLNMLRTDHWKNLNPWLWNRIYPYIENTDLEDGQREYLLGLR